MHKGEISGINICNERIVRRGEHSYGEIRGMYLNIRISETFECMSRILSTSIYIGEGGEIRGTLFSVAILKIRSQHIENDQG